MRHFEQGLRGNRIISILLFVVFFTSCQTYTTQNSKMRDQMYANNTSEAIKTLDNSSISTEDRNYVLFRMEKGMLLYLDKHYDEAVKLWTQADTKLDDLYTTSISRTANSFLINDSMSDYNGEAHERILLPIFSSMAFFANNNINNAQVMIRRTYDVMNTLQDQKNGERTLKYETFSHYFSGLVYESKNNWDNALVEYRLALNNISESGKLEGKIEILKALGRIAEYKNRNDILNGIKKEKLNITWESQKNLMNKGEVYIIYESGKSPIKVAEDIIIPTGKTVVKISFPKYKDLNYSSRYADIYVDNKLSGRTIVMENIGQMAKEALTERRVRDIARMSARVIAKDLVARKLNEENPYVGLAANLFNSAVEVADTRSWTTLPDTIQIARIPIEANKQVEITIVPPIGEQLKYSVMLNPGEKKFYRFRTYN